MAATLLGKNITVGAWDPHIDSSLYPEGVVPVEDITDAEGYDLVILVTAHKACLEIDWNALLERMRTPIVYDGRRVLDLNELESMGWATHAVGKPV